ncbi:MAG: hypothetical protein L0Z55_09115 [Planctomycetes bacterium]|nr:hypothetical protein [Planctomycetota bacterium]
MSVLRTVACLAVGIASLAVPSLVSAGDCDVESRFGRRHGRLEREIRRPLHHRVVRERHDRYPVYYESSDHRYRRLSCDCVEVYREGCYRAVIEEVCEPGYCESRWIPGCYETRIVFGCKIRFEVSAGRYEKTWHPPVVRKVQKKIWVPGGWISSKRCDSH